MIKRKKLRTRGKIRLSRYFQKFEKGEIVAVLRELSLQPEFPKQIQGRSGVVEEKRGNSYIIKIKDFNKEKRYIIHPVHLIKLSRETEK